MTREWHSKNKNYNIKRQVKDKKRNETPCISFLDETVEKDTQNHRISRTINLNN